MEIRESKYKVGDRVLEIGNPKSGIWEVQQIIEYDFTIDLYRYLLIHADGINLFASEKNLKPYIEKPKTVWDLKEGDYYVIANINGGVSEIHWDGMAVEKGWRELGNCFLTKEEAKFEVERRKIETEMLRLGGRRYLKLLKENYCFCFDSEFSSISCECFSCLGICSSIYFDSEKEALKALNTIGKDKIKKYIFGVE